MAATESQILVIIENLLDAANDKNEKVRYAIYSSLKKMATYYASDILTATINYRQRNSNLSNQEIRYLFNLINDICEEKLADIDYSLILLIIECAIEECSKHSDLPFVSADILTIISSKYCDEIYERILNYMQGGVTPHASIIYIIGNLSVVNVNTFVPFSKTVFNYILSVLPSVKTDSMRKSYATAINQLINNIIEHIFEDKSCVEKEVYSSVVEEIYEIFVSSWLQIKDSKVSESVVSAIGSMILLFSTKKLCNDAARIVTTFLSLYKKTPIIPRYIITHGISNFLSVVPRSALQPSLENLFHALHVMVWITPDFSQPLTVRNHSELLRCYDHIGMLFGEKLCETVLRNLRSSSEQDKVVALIVATHLLNASEQILRPKITELIAVLHTLLGENSVKINRSLVKIITALAHRGYLTAKDTAFIEFLAKHSYHSSINSDLESLESMCRNTIYLLSTSVPAIQHLCWKVLLQILINREYNQAAAVTAKSLAYLVCKCDTAILEQSYHERSEVVFISVISLLGSPLHETRGVHLLNFLNAYVLWKVKIDTYIWKHKISALIAYLENSEWNDTKWEIMLLDLLSSSFTEDTNPWLVCVNSEILISLSEQQTNNERNQIAYVNNNNIAIEERSMLYKMLALFTRYLDDEQAINTNIEKILFPIHQRSLLDLKACSRSIGILSKSNFVYIFQHLELLQQIELTRKTTKFLGLLKDTKCENDVEIVRRMICECYASMLEAPSRMLLSKLKQLILWFIFQIQITKDSQSRNTCTDAILKISEILLTHQETYENVEECTNSILLFISNLIESEKLMPNTTILQIMTVLFKLSVNLPPIEKLQLLQKCFNKMFQYYSTTIDVTSVTRNEVTNHDPVIQQLSLLIKETINTESNSVLEEIVTFLQPWLSHRVINHRLISMFLLKSVLQNYVEYYFNDVKIQGHIRFSHIGSSLGRVCVRTFEENIELKTLAHECVILLLVFAESGADNANASIEDIRKIISNAKNFSVESTQMSAFSKLTSEQLSLFLENLINGLLDSEDCCSLGTARLLTKLFTEIGFQFHRQAMDIFNGILLKLVKIDSESIQVSCIDVMLALAYHHKEFFVNTMLIQSLPFHSNVCKCWYNLSENKNFADDVLKYLLEVLEINPSYDNVGQNKRKISTRPIAIIFAIKDILHSTTTTDLVKNHFADLFSLLLMMIPGYMGEVIMPALNKDSANILIPGKLIFDTLLIVMERAECDNVEERLRPFSNKIEFNKPDKKPIYFQMISTATRCICHFHWEYMLKILKSLNNYTDDSRTETQRTTVVLIYTEVLNTKCNENSSVLINTIITYLLNLLNDSSPVVREYILKGLSSIPDLDFTLMNRYKENILSALMKGLDDDDAITQPDIVIHSLTGLSKLSRFLDRDDYASVLLSIAIRIKPFFEKENVEMRCLSLKLFGELACVSGVESSAYSDQVKRNLICLLFHLAEKNPAIVQACKYSLRAVSFLLKSEKVSSMITKHLIDDANLFYKEYLTKITELLAEEFPELSSDFILMAISYSKSTWPEIKAAAATFMGVMYSSQTKESGKILEKLSADTVSCRLLILLKDNDADVRASAAVSLGLLISATFPFAVINN